MEQIIKELRQLIYTPLHLTALNIALTIPDICASLESEDGKTSGEKYRQWVDKYFSPKYIGWIVGEDIYKLRCSCLHQGKLDHDKSE